MLIKKILAMSVLVLTVPTLAYANPQFEITMNSVMRSRGKDKQDVNLALELGKKIAQQNNLNTKYINLKDRQGNSYQALQVLSSPTSEISNEIEDLRKNFGNIKLVFSPYDLGRSGAKAFFDPNGSKLGAPYTIVYGKLSESYFHEKMHADTYLKVLNKEEDTFAGSMKLLKGSRISQYYHDGYIRHASFDENLTTEFSLKENTKELYQIYRSSSQSEFLNDDLNEDILGDIKFSLENAIGLSKQVKDVIAQARTKVQLGQYKITRIKLTIGNISRTVDQVEILVNSTDRVFNNGRGEQIDVANGTELKFQMINSSKDSILNKFKKIENEANRIITKYPAALKEIGTRIFYADLKSTNITALYNAVF